MPVYVEISARVMAAFRLNEVFKMVVATVAIRLEIAEGSEYGCITLTKETTLDQVPNFTISANRGHIFEPSSNDVDFLEERLAAIEGLLSSIGVKQIDFSRIGRRWFEVDNVWGTKKDLFGYTSDHEARPKEKVVLSPEFLEPLIQVAVDGRNDNVCLAQRFFHLGWDHFCNYRYVDCIHQLCFFIELLFANGKFKIKEQVAALESSTLFQTSLVRAKKELLEEVKRGDLSISNANRLLINVGPRQFAHWVCSTRGNYLHQSSKRRQTWHPSNAMEHKMNATVLAFFCASAAQEAIGNLAF